jgi:antitoxin VapB
MQTAKIFQNGRSQAVRLPKEFRFKSSDIYIKKFEDIVLLIPKKVKSNWEFLTESLNKFSDDFMIDYKQTEIQNREQL